MTGHIDYFLDKATGIVRVTGTGLWTVPQIETHFSRLSDFVHQLRADGKLIRVLVDTSAAPVQSAEVADRIKARTQLIYRPGDRIAMIVGSTMAKMQMRRVVSSSMMELFVSPKAAEIWLSAYDERATAA